MLIKKNYSHTGSQIAGHLGSSHFHAHCGWQWGSAYSFKLKIYTIKIVDNKNFIFITNINKILDILQKYKF